MAKAKPPTAKKATTKRKKAKSAAGHKLGTKPSILAKAARATGLPVTTLTAAYDAIFYAIAVETAAGHRVSVRNFGTFQAKTLAARKVRSIRTKKIINVPARFRLKFKASSNVYGE